MIKATLQIHSQYMENPLTAIRFRISQQILINIRRQLSIPSRLSRNTWRQHLWQGWWLSPGQSVDPCHFCGPIEQWKSVSVHDRSSCLWKLHSTCSFSKAKIIMNMKKPTLVFSPILLQVTKLCWKVCRTVFSTKSHTLLFLWSTRGWFAKFQSQLNYINMGN